MADISAPPPGTLNWRLSAHPITLVTFLSFRISSLLVYLLGLLFTTNFVLIFIITILLLAADFYYLKNIAGRRLVGLRWWNEVNGSTGDSHWVFESAPQPNEPGGKTVNATDKRFFWLALYAQPALWVGLAVVAVVIWEANEAIVIALVLTITNTLAFSRCDKFSQASGLLGGGLYSATLARNVGDHEKKAAAPPRKAKLLCIMLLSLAGVFVTRICLHTRGLFSSLVRDYGKKTPTARRGERKL
ncbi:Golgi apparatus membrane protein tvp23 [Elasticomyces elasticus]|nr:Golgi apparatus membrane protein tvp23 [Elasticomyces elasticus]